MDYDLALAPTSTPAVLFFGTSNTLWNAVPLPLDLAFLNAAGCAVRTDSLIAMGLATGVAGTASLRVRIPISVSLIGSALYTQYMVYDPSANGLGLTTTRGIGTLIGGRQ